MLLLRGVDPTDYLSTADPVLQAVIGGASERANELRQHELENLAVKIANAIARSFSAGSSSSGRAGEPS